MIGRKLHVMVHLSTPNRLRNIIGCLLRRLGFLLRSYYISQM
ncbi:hypothetical protein GYH30_003364 [Glycine max]|nr:hypothetical protein GYH30_003364 [Glycine max]